MQKLFRRVLESEKTVSVGSRGRGLSTDFAWLSEVADMSSRVLARRRRRLRSFSCGASFSSPELDGVCGGEGSDTVSVMTICRWSVTEIVASEAISRARLGDRGVVVKTTKKGIEELREKVTDVGKVT